MQLDLTFRGIDPSPSLAAFARAWARRLARVHAGIQRCEIRIEVPHRRQRQGRRFHVVVGVTVPGREIVVTRDPGDDDAHADPYVALRDACRAARRQLDEHARAVREEPRALAAS